MCSSWNTSTSTTPRSPGHKDFRLALNYAADREAILQAVYFGIGSVPNSYMPKVNFHSDAVPAIPFDIAKAKELVAASGYDGTPVDLMIDSGNATSRQIATILQQGWGEAGINVNIVEFDAGTAWGMVTKLEHTMYVSYITSDINDTDEIATLQADGSSGTNGFFSGYNNPDMKVLLDEARASSDPALRAANYAKVQETLVYDGYSVPLNFSPLIPGHQADVMGFKQLSTGFWWLQDVWLDRS
ncbi:MAG: ABC transporter substrate-binding protein [Rhodobacteraceae bacterium]|nr:ABC transporter substrate-binding protein [Paracoccaceae bacterium]